MTAAKATRPGLAWHGPLASVRLAWGDWHVAHVPLTALRELHWDRIGGEVSAALKAPVLFGFTRCDAVVAGELPHADLAGDHPHDLRVCILREDNDRVIFDRLALEAGRRPRDHAVVPPPGPDPDG